MGHGFSALFNRGGCLPPRTHHGRQLKYLVFIAVVAVYVMSGRNDLKLLQDAYYSDRWDK